jgi:hypothetical protein
MQDVANRLIADLISQIGQGSGNPVVAPVPVLLGHPNDQLLDLACKVIRFAGIKPQRLTGPYPESRFGGFQGPRVRWVTRVGLVASLRLQRSWQLSERTYDLAIFPTRAKPDTF